MKRRLLAPLLCLGLCLGLVAAAALAADRAAEAEKLLRMLHAGKFAEFHARCNAEVKQALPVDRLRAVVESLGALESLEARPPSGDTYVFRAKLGGGVFLALLTFDAQDLVAGLFYKPAPPESPPPNVDHKTRTRLSLPFRGAWTVGNGGRDAAKNNHVGNAQQSFAYDFTREHEGDGKKLADYAAWGAEVLAPADASVVEAVDGVPDLEVGDRDPYVIPGNHVMLDLGNGEFALLAHFQRGTVRVKPGQKVARGELLGKCGNSGNTSEPHIHFHLQDAAVLHHGKGIPAPFADILVDGKPAQGVEPERGRRVENAVGAAAPR